MKAKNVIENIITIKTNSASDKYILIPYQEYLRLLDSKKDIEQDLREAKERVSEKTVDFNEFMEKL